MQMRESTLKRFLRLPKFDEHLALHWMDASSAHGDLRLYEFAKERYEATPVEDDEAEAAGDGKGSDRGRISAGAGVQGDAGGGGGCTARGPGGDDGGGAGGRERAIWPAFRLRTGHPKRVVLRCVFARRRLRLSWSAQRIRDTAPDHNRLSMPMLRGARARAAQPDAGPRI